MLILITFLLLNGLTFFLYYYDKKKAINNQYRISEKILLSFSFLGGSVGALCAMYYFHHKTKKMLFIVLNWLFLVIQLAFFQYLGG